MLNWDSAARAAVEGVDVANDNERLLALARHPARKGDWMQTYTGRQFWPMDPHPEEVYIEDIAHSLAMQCRFAGHCLRFYSVAEHSVLMSRYVSPANALWALLHDAGEAYLVDVPRPLKPFLAGYKDAERAVMGAITQRFQLPPEMPIEVHEADNRIIADERANMAECVAEWSGGYDNPLGVALEYWDPGVAELMFLDMFGKLTGNRGRWV